MQAKPNIYTCPRCAGARVENPGEQPERVGEQEHCRRCHGKGTVKWLGYAEQPVEMPR